MRNPPAEVRLPESPPEGECYSNGIIQRTVGLVVGQARSLKGALEDRMV